MTCTCPILTAQTEEIQKKRNTTTAAAVNFYHIPKTLEKRRAAPRSREGHPQYSAVRQLPPRATNSDAGFQVLESVTKTMEEKEAPQLSALLKEMKEGLDAVRSKIQSLTAKVKENQFSTADGFSYLEAKNLLLLNYCQTLVYYLLQKAKGFSIEGHPVVRSIVEIRLYLEKIRPIDKKQQYQIQKLTNVSESAMGNAVPSEKEPVAPNKSEDVSKYRPNPDMLVSRLDNTSQDGDGVYRPVKIAPTSMEQDKTSKHERNVLRREKEILRQAGQSDYIRSLMNDMEERPEEVRDFVGTTREVDNYVAKMEDRARQEEELFTRVPLTKMEKKREKHLKKSRNGLQGLTESFYDEIKTLPFEDKSGEQMMGSSNGSSRNGRLNKRKRH